MFNLTLKFLEVLKMSKDQPLTAMDIVKKFTQYVIKDLGIKYPITFEKFLPPKMRSILFV